MAQDATNLQADDVSHKDTTAGHSCLDEHLVSRWNPERGVHELLITVVSKLPFYVEPTSTSAGLAGESQLQLVAKTSCFRFDQLPPEVRNLIFSNVLDGPTINIILNTSAGQRSEEAKACVKKNTVFMSGKTTAIFLVNKAMSHEARAWFYGSREFSFQNSMACRRLLEAIGSNRAPLRYITISRVTMSAQATFQSLLWLLKDTKKLADLTLLTDDAEILMRAILGCSMRTDLKKSTHFMLPFSQFLAQLHDVRSDPNEAKYIVTFGFNGSSRVNGKASDFAWFRKEMLRQVKAEVAKLEVKREE